MIKHWLWRWNGWHKGKMVIILHVSHPGGNGLNGPTKQMIHLATVEYSAKLYCYCQDTNSFKRPRGFILSLTNTLSWFFSHVQVEVSKYISTYESMLFPGRRRWIWSGRSVLWGGGSREKKQILLAFSICASLDRTNTMLIATSESMLSLCLCGVNTRRWLLLPLHRKYVHKSGNGTLRSIF